LAPDERSEAIQDGLQAELVGVLRTVGSAVSGTRGRDDAGMDVVFLRRGLDMLPEDQRHDHAAGLILAFEVDDLEGELARLQAAGVAITMPLRSEAWGERAFQVRDPNGVIVELLDWNAPKPKPAC
jgi:catechol 2,3-dioxygenase-like lactoylglutathione lyase family enzyme